MLLEMKAIPEFVRCLRYKDVDAQLAAARAIGNFALDAYGRNKVFDQHSDQHLTSVLTPSWPPPAPSATSPSTPTAETRYLTSILTSI